MILTDEQSMNIDADCVREVIDGRAIFCSRRLSTALATLVDTAGEFLSRRGPLAAAIKPFLNIGKAIADPALRQPHLRRSVTRGLKSLPSSDAYSDRLDRFGASQNANRI
jgi:hypothetical protein